MNRYLAWWWGVAAVGLLVGLWTVNVFNVASAQQFPGRGEDPDHGSITCVLILYADGYKEARPPGCDEEPTATPWPTSIPTATATSTATIIPSPTLADEPTLEPGPLPTATPGPTAIPKACELRARYTINIREAVRGQWVGSWNAGDYRSFDAFVYVENGYLWGHSNTAPAGWTVVFNEPDLTDSAWWVNGTATSGTCYEVEGWPLHIRPPEPFAGDIRSGPHVLMGEGGSVVQNFAAKLTAAKCLPGSYQVCLALKAANPQIYIIARPLTDLLATEYDFDPVAAWQAVAASVPQGFDALELENESTPPDENIPQWVQFSIGLAGLVARDTGMQYLAFSFGPGHPPYEIWSLLVPYLEWVAAHPLPDGRYHGIAIHAAPYATFDRSDMPWVNDLHVAGRLYLARDVLLANTGFDLARWPGIMAVTEIGLSDGYSGNWDASYSCAEAADAYRTTRIIYAEHGYPQIFTWWNFGQIGWHSDHECAQVMFGRLP